VSEKYGNSPLKEGMMMMCGVVLMWLVFVGVRLGICGDSGEVTVVDC
jgi:hypothetical protein